jgi:tetratricopeptide (TPR) repeat protein
MLRRVHRGVALALVIVALAMLALMIYFIRRADDFGAAAISVITFLISTALAVLQMVRAPRNTSDSADTRQALLEATRNEQQDLARRLPAPSDRAEFSLRRIYGQSDVLRATSDCLAEFDSSSGRLALLGAPGAGKTTLAASLMKALLDRATADATQPIPVYVRLTEWKPGTPLETWLQHHLVERWNLSAEQASTAASSLTPVLDGLDEVEQTQRDQCAQALSDFIGRNPGAQLVVTCRLAEYRSLPTTELGQLRTYILQPLSPETLIEFFSSIDQGRWNGVTSEIARPGSALPALLATPLMIAAVLGTWGDESSNPNSLVALGRQPVKSLEEAKATIWRLWLAKATKGDSKAQDLAVSLSSTAMQTGAVDIRLERLGSSNTRRTWFLLVGIATGILAYVTGQILFPLAVFTFEGANAVGRRLAYFRWYANRHARHLAGVGFYIAAITLGGIAGYSGSEWPALTGMVGLLAGPLIGFWLGSSRSELLPGAAWRLFVDSTRTPFSVVRAQTIALLSCFALISGVALASLRALGLSLSSSYALAGIAVLWASSFVGLHFVGQHWLSRLWFRVRGNGGSSRSRLNELVRYSVLRPVGDGYRFFHLELQTYLAAATSTRDVYKFENIGIEALYGHVRRLIDEGDFARTLEILDRAENVNRHERLTFVLRGIAHDALGQQEKALHAFDRALLASPNVAVVHTFRAKALRQLNQSGEALRAHDEAIALDPSNADAYFQKGVTLTSADRNREALECFRTALVLDPVDPDIHYRHGLALAALDHPSEALEAFDHALVLVPDSATLHVARGQLLHGLGRVDEALQALSEAVALEPDNPEAHYRHGLALAALDHPSEALEAFNHALVLVPAEPAVLEARAAVTGRLQD